MAFRVGRDDGLEKSKEISQEKRKKKVVDGIRMEVVAMLLANRSPGKDGKGLKNG